MLSAAEYEDFFERILCFSFFKSERTKNICKEYFQVKERERETRSQYDFEVPSIFSAFARSYTYTAVQLPNSLPN